MGDEELSLEDLREILALGLAHSVEALSFRGVHVRFARPTNVPGDGTTAWTEDQTPHAEPVSHPIRADHPALFPNGAPTFGRRAK